MTAVDPQPGDWVLIRAKVLGRPRPEEVTVRLFSKTDEYEALIRVDRCEVAEKPIPAEPDEGSVALAAGTAHQRLGDGYWYSAGEVGRSYGLTWPQLHALGDVEVIHHV